MKLYYAIFVLFTLFIYENSCKAQQEDSLRKVVYNKKHIDTIQMLAMTELAARLRNTHPDSCLYLARLAYQKASLLPFPKGQGRAKRVEGVYYQNARGDYHTALKLFRQALLFSKQSQDMLGEAYSYNSIASIYRQQGIYEDALHYYFKALHLYNTLGKEQIPIYGNTLYSIGYIYHNLGMFEKALAYYTDATKTYLQNSDQQGLATTYNKIGEVYEQEGRLQTALQMQWKSLGLVRQLQSPFLTTFSYASLSLLYLHKKTIDSAVWYAQKGLSIAQQHQSTERIAHLETVLAACYNAQLEYAKAYKLASIAKKVAQEIGAIEYFVAACQQQYYAASKLNKPLEALQTYEQLVAVRDSLQGITNQKKVLAKEFEHEESKIKIEQEKREMEHQMIESRQRQIMYSLGGLAIALFVIAVLVYKNNYDKQQLNKLLKRERNVIEQKNKQLEEVNSTKDKLFSIIGHDLRSPMGNLKTLLNLVSTGEMSTEELQALLPSLHQNVNTIYDTLENLLQWSYAQMKGLRSNPSIFDIGKIIALNIQLFNEVAHYKHISIVNEVKETVWVLADENQILLVLRNLLNNALKFTHIGGKIELKVTLDNQMVAIGVGDNGVGVPPNLLDTLFQPSICHTTQGTQGEKGSGLGLKLCKEMVEHNKGTIWVESEIGKGTTFWFTLPLVVKSSTHLPKKLVY